jgi:hypothetical protein
MKKRIFAGILAFFLFVPLVLTGGAQTAVYFTAVDERVLDLKDSTMPFWFGG